MRYADDAPCPVAATDDASVSPRSHHSASIGQPRISIARSSRLAIFSDIGVSGRSNPDHAGTTAVASSKINHSACPSADADAQAATESVPPAASGAPVACDGLHSRPTIRVDPIILAPARDQVDTPQYMSP